MLGGSTLVFAQANGSLELGASWVDYKDFQGSGTKYFSPTVRYDNSNTSIGTSGSYIVFESGSRILQGLAAGAWRADLGPRFRGEVSGSAGFNVYNDNIFGDSEGFGHLLGRTRLHYQGRRSGAWIGGATGRAYQNEAGATPYEIELGGWVVHEGLALGANAKRAWIETVSYIDLVATTRWRDRYFEIDGSLGWRGWNDGGGRGVYGELQAQVPIWKWISALVSGGRYPSDHVRGTVSANFVSVALRITTFNSSYAPSEAPLRALFRELERPDEPEAGEARLTVHKSLEDLHTIQVEAPNAEVVELTADFTDWRPIILRQARNGNWEITVRISSGVHRVNVRIDDGPWVVPLGLRSQEDDFGGSVGMLVVR